MMQMHEAAVLPDWTLWVSIPTAIFCAWKVFSLQRKKRRLLRYTKFIELGPAQARKMISQKERSQVCRDLGKHMWVPCREAWARNTALMYCCICDVMGQPDEGGGIVVNKQLRHWCSGETE